MAYAGQILKNPASGERITIRRTAAETGGELLAIDLELPPGRRVPGGLHRHPRQEERFAVVRGRMRFTLGRERIDAGPGEVVVVPPGVAHDFANAGSEDALVRVEVRPALQMERLFERAVLLAEQGRTFANGIPKPLDLALMAREFAREVEAAFAPRWLQRVALAPLVWMADIRDQALALTQANDRRPHPTGSGRLGAQRTWSLRPAPIGGCGSVGLFSVAAQRRPCPGSQGGEPADGGCGIDREF